MESYWIVIVDRDNDGWLDDAITDRSNGGVKEEEEEEEDDKEEDDIGIGLKSTRRVLGHSLIRSLVRSHCSPIRFLGTASFARALRSAYSFVRSLAHSLTRSQARGKEIFFYELNASISYYFGP